LARVPLLLLVLGARATTACRQCSPYWGLLVVLAVRAFGLGPVLAVLVLAEYMLVLGYITVGVANAVHRLLVAGVVRARPRRHGPAAALSVWVAVFLCVSGFLYIVRVKTATV
jgi:uncharacterized membrane protein YvlD (DUF360 family)